MTNNTSTKSLTRVQDIKVGDKIRYHNGTRVCYKTVEEIFDYGVEFAITYKEGGVGYWNAHAMFDVVPTPS